MKLNLDTLRDALKELGQKAVERGKVIDIAIYGGSALMLASNFRIATQDVDAVADGDDQTLEALVSEIAIARQWPRDWLNDGVRTYLSPNVDGFGQNHELFASYPNEQQPGLRVFIPTASYLLAMKLMAMRIDSTAGPKDLDDIVNLVRVTGLKSSTELVDLAAGFYPEARVSGRLRLGLQTIWDHYTKSTTNEQSHAPIYPLRSGPKAP